ncbi:MAG: aspartate ammonia-lyase [Desulfovibrio sp.]|uniref:aspartate ammonia-lyase n=1 Tax=Desulfovibrio sp. 7SRBS1 TaxID=3378064 RepID=UPI003B3ED5DC
MNECRLEHDCIGEREVPDVHYYGVQTLRAVENYPISRISISHYPRLIDSLAYIKMAAAYANNKLGLLDDNKARHISLACEDILEGKLYDQFVVDVIQGGAGTSTNMNANEVIANRGLEIMGHKRGQYEFLHPNSDVNMSQSTNDVYPTAVRITLITKIRLLIEAMGTLKASFERKAEEFAPIIKMGRTQLQDAVPMSLGQEFAAYAVMIGEDMQRLDEAKDLVREINMGATAIGTGLNAHPDYADVVTKKLSDLIGIELIKAHDLVEATQDTGAYVQLSGVLKRVAVKASKICNDLRLMSSGPRCGLNEINLPPRAPGSSIMPGKVNPVIPEVVNQTCFYVVGADMTVTMACEAGQLELNVMEPVIAHSLFSSLMYLHNAFLTLAHSCVDGITANEEVCRGYVRNSIGLVTALNPYIGYEKSTEVAHEAMRTNASVYDIVLEKGYLTKDDLDDILSPENMLRPRYFHEKK